MTTFDNVMFNCNNVGQTSMSAHVLPCHAAETQYSGFMIARSLHVRRDCQNNRKIRKEKKCLKSLNITAIRYGVYVSRAVLERPMSFLMIYGVWANFDTRFTVRIHTKVIVDQCVVLYTAIVLYQYIYVA